MIPKEALKRASDVIGDAEKAKDFLLMWLGCGQIRASAAVTQRLDSSPIMNKRVAPEIRQNFRQSCPSSLWETGAAKYQSEEYIGIHFDEAQVEKIITDHAPPAPEAAEAKERGSGRSSGYHGEVIAALTARYLLADRDDFATLTPRVLATDLEAEYKALGASPPSARNLQSITNGILKVIHKNRPSVG